MERMMWRKLNKWKREKEARSGVVKKKSKRKQQQMIGGKEIKSCEVGEV